MDNWLFFLIVGIGIISSFLNKKTKTISQGPISKPFEVETPSTTYVPKYKVEARRSEKTNKTAPNSTVAIQYTDGIKEIKQERVKKHDAYTERQKENLVDIKIEANQVAQGVIWSEILGPPRSRRPHSLRQR